MYYIFVENEKIIGKGQAKAISDTIKSISVTFEQFENIDSLKYQDGEIVQKTESEIEEEKTKERQIEFEKDFFLTSFGYIRRKVNMATGEIRDFLFDLLPAIEKSVSIGQPYPVIVYKQPDFTKEITTEYLVSLQEFKNATEQFCKECTLQIGTDFSGVPMTLEE